METLVNSPAVSPTGATMTKWHKATIRLTEDQMNKLHELFPRKPHTLVIRGIIDLFIANAESKIEDATAPLKALASQLEVNDGHDS